MSTAELVSGVRHAMRQRIRSGGPIRHRLPTAASVKAAITGGNLSEATIIASIRIAMERMHREGRLGKTTTVENIMAAIYPSPGHFNAKLYAKWFDASGPSAVYEHAAAAQAKISDSDKPRLLAAMTDALDCMAQAAKRDNDLKQVFGSANVVRAKSVYAKARFALRNVRGDLDAHVHTDYNSDDAQVGLGGWAQYERQFIHFQPGVARVADNDEAIITILHECCHLADDRVVDLGYYGSEGFEAMDESEKICNAAHFEEVPRRIRGKSSYDGLMFTPGQKKSGGKVTYAESIKRDASEYLRMAWDKAVDVHAFLREILAGIEKGGDRSTFTNNAPRILEISQLEGLTVHHQTGAQPIISTLDIVLSEGIARALSKIDDHVDAQHVPLPPNDTDPGRRQADMMNVVHGCIADYGMLTGDAATDSALLEWLVREYQKPL